MLSKKNIFFLFSLLFLLCLTPRVFALNTINYNSTQFVYTDNTSDTWSSSTSYRTGTNKYLKAINVYYPNFEGYYTLTLTIEGNPALYIQNGNNLLGLSWQYFTAWVYENGSYNQNYFIGQCYSQTNTCNFTFNSTNKQLASNNFNVQLLMADNAWIYNPSFKITSTLYYSADADESSSDIINNQIENTQNIINNQNDNTDKEIESQKSCTYVDNSYIELSNYYLNTNGSNNPLNGWGITKYFRISQSSEIKKTYIVGSPGAAYCFYNNKKDLISCNNNYNDIVIPDGSYYVRFSIASNANYPRFTICTNGNQAINDSMQDINNSLNDDSEPDTNNFLQDISSMVSSDTPITDLLVLPLTLINTYVDSLNGTCTPFDLGELYNTHIVFPCINLESKLGSNLWSLIDSFFTLFMVYNVAMLCVHIYDSMTSLNDSFEGLYTPKHVPSSYQPRHGE